MNEQKSFIHYIVEAIDRYRIEQRARASEQGTQSRTPSRLRRFLRWLTPNGGSLLLVLVLIATAQVWAKPLASPASPGPSATTVNYQGRLSDSDGVPLDGTYGMSFALYDAATDGGLVWGPEEHTAVEVSDGLFSVGLGSKTSGGIPTTTWNGDRYLEITVGGETLEPRELIRSVPIAGMALTVPDGAIKSNNLSLDSGTVCLSEHTTIEVPGDYDHIPVPGLSLDFSLDQPSQVLIWIDGLARLYDGEAQGQAAIGWEIDGEKGSGAGSYHFSNTDKWFNVKGQRLLDLESGPHSIEAWVNSLHPGTMKVHGNGSLRTCLNYLVLGEQ